MESEQIPNPNVEHVERSDQFANLKKITPLSKYLAMTLFILLPFVGGYVGYVYAPEKVVEVERVEEYSSVQADTSVVTDSTVEQPPAETLPRGTPVVAPEVADEAVDENPVAVNPTDECVAYEKPICSYGWNIQPTQICPQAAECLYDELVDIDAIVEIETDAQMVAVSLMCDVVNNMALAWGDGTESQPCSPGDTTVVERHLYDSPGTYMLSIINRDSWNDGSDRIVEQSRIKIP